MDTPGDCGAGMDTMDTPDNPDPQDKGNRGLLRNKNPRTRGTPAEAPRSPVVAVGSRRHTDPAPEVPSRFSVPADQGRVHPGRRRPPPRCRFSWAQAGAERGAPAQEQGVPRAPRAQPRPGRQQSRCLPDAAVGSGDHPVLADQGAAAEVEAVVALPGRAALSTRHRGRRAPCPGPARPQTLPPARPGLSPAATPAMARSPAPPAPR